MSMNKGALPERREFHAKEEWYFAVMCWLVFAGTYAFLVVLASIVVLERVTATDQQIHKTQHFAVLPSIKIDICETTHDSESMLNRIDAKMLSWTIYADEAKSHATTMTGKPVPYTHKDFRCLRFDTDNSSISSSAVLVHTQLHVQIIENETYPIPASRLSHGPVWGDLISKAHRLANGFYFRLSLAEDINSEQAFSNEEIVPRLIPSANSAMSLVMPAFGKVHKAVFATDLPTTLKNLFGAPVLPADTFYLETLEFQTFAGSTQGGSNDQHIRGNYPLILDVEVIDTNVHVVEYVNARLDNALTYLMKVASYTLLFGILGMFFPIKVPLIRRSRIPILRLLEGKEAEPLVNGQKKTDSDEENANNANYS